MGGKVPALQYPCWQMLWTLKVKISKSDIVQQWPVGFQLISILWSLKLQFTHATSGLLSGSQLPESEEKQNDVLFLGGGGAGEVSPGNVMGIHIFFTDVKWCYKSIVYLSSLSQQVFNPIYFNTVLQKLKIVDLFRYHG